jgi:hypothetical protein
MELRTLLLLLLLPANLVKCRPCVSSRKIHFLLHHGSEFLSNEVWKRLHASFVKVSSEITCALAFHQMVYKFK